MTDTAAPPLAHPLDDLEWWEWLKLVFPNHITARFAEHHVPLWEWVWALEQGTRPDPLVEILGRGGAKSTSAEMAVVVTGAKQQRRYWLYVCHESGTEIIDPDKGRMIVDDHPTARPRPNEIGKSVKVAGMSYAETVTMDHRYWARRIARRDRKGRGTEYLRGRPQWIEAQDLDWNTWLGLPIGFTEIDGRPELTEWSASAQAYLPVERECFTDPEWWWAVGLWWGDGTIGGASRSQVSWAMADAHPDHKDRLLAVLGKYGYDAKVRPAPDGSKHSIVTIGDSVISRWLHTWKRGRNRKEPPEFVEWMPLDRQAGLLRGYYDADGSITDRGATLTSIHLPGLLAVRRMLLRLGVVPQLVHHRSPGVSTFPGGRSYATARAYRIDIRQGAEALGYDPLPMDYDHLDQFIEDGVLWSRVKEVTDSAPTTFVAITTSTSDYLTAYALSHNCGTQDRADDHVQTIGNMLESPEVAVLFPDLSEKQVGKYGNSRGWRRNRLWTASGFVVDAIGLDTAARGVKLDDQRPDGLVLDEIDGRHDSTATTQKKIEALTEGILPAGSPDVATLAVQNLIHRDSVFAQLADGRADFLKRRTVIGPIPALRNFSVDEEGLVQGDPTWEGQSLATCQAQVDDWGLRAFRREAQHEVTESEGALWSRAQVGAMRRDGTASGPLAVMPEAWKNAVVMIDPSGGDGPDNDEVGIVGTCRGYDDLGYVAGDWSGSLAPEAWGRLAVLKAIETGFMTIGSEPNYGGAMVVSTVQNAIESLASEGVEAARSVRVLDPKNFRATTGKRQRAEPVASMCGEPNDEASWRRGVIRLCGDFTRLEDELTGWVPDVSRDSPNRADSFWWTIHYLFPERMGTAVPRTGVHAARRRRGSVMG